MSFLAAQTDRKADRVVMEGDREQVPALVEDMAVAAAALAVEVAGRPFAEAVVAVGMAAPSS